MARPRALTVVTGCASGIGAAVAALARGAGARVMGIDLSAPDEHTVDEFVQVDLGTAEGVQRAIAAIASIGAPQEVYHCAGVTGARGAATTMRVNVLAVRHLTDGLAEVMAPGAAIAAVGSIGALPWRGHPAVDRYLAGATWTTSDAWCGEHAHLLAPSAYPFSKACVVELTKRTAVRLAPRGIRMNVVSPGVVDTPMIRSSTGAGHASGVDVFFGPLGRMTTAAEQAAVLRFVNSAAASCVVGVELLSDGGFTASVTTGSAASPLPPAPGLLA